VAVAVVGGFCDRRFQALRCLWMGVRVLEGFDLGIFPCMDGWLLPGSMRHLHRHTLRVGARGLEAVEGLLIAVGVGLGV